MVSTIFFLVSSERSPVPVTLMLMVAGAWTAPRPNTSSSTSWVMLGAIKPDWPCGTTDGTSGIWPDTVPCVVMDATGAPMEAMPARMRARLSSHSWNGLAGLNELSLASSACDSPNLSANSKALSAFSFSNAFLSFSRRISFSLRLSFLRAASMLAFSVSKISPALLSFSRILRRRSVSSLASFFLFCI